MRTSTFFFRNPLAIGPLPSVSQSVFPPALIRQGPIVTVIGSAAGCTPAGRRALSCGEKNTCSVHSAGQDLSAVAGLAALSRQGDELAAPSGAQAGSVAFGAAAEGFERTAGKCRCELRGIVFYRLAMLERKTPVGKL